MGEDRGEPYKIGQGGCKRFWETLVERLNETIALDTELARICQSMEG